ncbi:MAG: hypothetical protein EZS28_017851 [Streblomastix strix]|uniref:Uncharacterized protein n=1 Tax=Streblomastix strix TaxID=222440 RepID=A0A5J4VWB1_9EUKA|nr:MAG: hypothetical protein EZS28_017851 [Streblomastix strix]
MVDRTSETNKSYGALLNINDLILPGYTVEINFTEKMHGKGEVDSDFAKYVQGIEKNMPKEGIRSLPSLAQLMQCISEYFNVAKFLSYVDYLIIDQFMLFHNFYFEGDSVKARPLIGNEVDEQTFPLEFDTRDKFSKKLYISVVLGAPSTNLEPIPARRNAARFFEGVVALSVALRRHTITAAQLRTFEDDTYSNTFVGMVYCVLHLYCLSMKQIFLSEIDS